MIGFTSMKLMSLLVNFELFFHSALEGQGYLIKLAHLLWWLTTLEGYNGQTFTSNFCLKAHCTGSDVQKKCKMLENELKIYKACLFAFLLDDLWRHDWKQCDQNCCDWNMRRLAWENCVWNVSFLKTSKLNI